jgi:hypothetical protein
MNIILQNMNTLLKFNRGRGRRGIAIYCAAVTLSIVLAIALGVGALAASRLKMMNEAGASVSAFAAAETGIEWSLLNVVAAGYDSGEVLLSNGASYRVESYSCGAANEFLCTVSVGKYGNSQRAIKVRQ